MRDNKDRLAINQNSHCSFGCMQPNSFHILQGMVGFARFLKVIIIIEANHSCEMTCEL